MTKRVKKQSGRIFSKGLYDTRKLLFATMVALIVPNVALCFTENMPLLVCICNLAWPLSFYSFLLSLGKNTGKVVCWTFPFMFLAAFQLVLLYLFGSGIIAVDMFLNVVTTNPGEAFELLDNIALGVLIVILLYIPLLLWSIVSIRRKAISSNDFIKKLRKTALIGFGITIPLTISCYIFVPTFSFKTDIFPANVCYNLFLSIERTYKTSHYEETSRDFSFHAKSTHNKDDKEIYMLVIGETARSLNFGIYGYERNTTPLLSRTKGAIVFTDALTQSNTTHKSVPMLMSAISAQNFDSIYFQKSIITAFKEAGFRTAFFSNQRRNRSFIDFFGQEADTCVFIKELETENNDNPNDNELLKYVEKEISGTERKLFIVLHTYGSHFKYNERYAADEAVFKPNTKMEADRKNKEHLVNAYDNTILQTDKLLNRLMRMLEESNSLSAMIYTSDHGEDIFDDDRNAFLHSSPVPSYYQLHVPLIVWTSQNYRSAYPNIVKNLLFNKRKPVSTSADVFYSMLDIAGISTPFQNDSLSLASNRFKPAERYFINDRNIPKRIDNIGLSENDLKMFSNKGLKFP